MTEQTLYLDFNLIPNNINNTISKLTLISHYFDKELTFIPSNIKELNLLLYKTSDDYIFNIPNTLSKFKLVSPNINNKIIIPSSLLELRLYCYKYNKHIDFSNTNLEYLSIKFANHSKYLILPKTLITLNISNEEYKLNTKMHNVSFPNKLKNLYVSKLKTYNNLPRLHTLIILNYDNRPLNNLPSSLKKLNFNFDDYCNPSIINVDSIQLESLNVKKNINYNNDNILELIVEDVKYINCIDFNKIEKLTIYTNLNRYIKSSSIKYLSIRNENFNNTFNLPNLENLTLFASKFNKPLNNLSNKLKELYLRSANFNQPLDLLPESLQKLYLNIDLSKSNSNSILNDLPLLTELSLFTINNNNNNYMDLTSLPSTINNLTSNLYINNFIIPNNCKKIIVSLLPTKIISIPDTLEILIISENFNLLDCLNINNDINLHNDNLNIIVDMNVCQLLESTIFDDSDYIDDKDIDFYYFYDNNNEDYNDYEYPNEGDDKNDIPALKNITINKILNLIENLKTTRQIKIHLYDSQTRKFILHDELFKNYSLNI